MNDEQLLRYNRQIMLPQIGYEGQQKLADARVLIIGLGGLGSPASMYLAADAGGREVQQAVEFVAPEGMALGGPLHLDETGFATIGGREHHDVHVDLGLTVLHIGQVEDGRPVDDADADRQIEGARSRSHRDAQWLCVLA